MSQIKKSFMRIINTSIKLVIFLFTFLFIYIYVSNAFVLPWQEKDALKTTLEWGGLNELPSGIKGFKIEKKGSPFTRQFIIEFELESSKKLNDWIKQSKRLRNNTPKIKGHIKIYEIYPGEHNSSGGTVEFKGRKIRIDMSWS